MGHQVTPGDISKHKRSSTRGVGRLPAHEAQLSPVEQFLLHLLLLKTTYLNLCEIIFQVSLLKCCICKMS